MSTHKVYIIVSERLFPARKNDIWMRRFAKEASLLCHVYIYIYIRERFPVKIFGATYWFQAPPPYHGLID